MIYLLVLEQSLISLTIEITMIVEEELTDSNPTTLDEASPQLVRQTHSGKHIHI